MKEKFIYKQITDAFYHILEKHGNPKWAFEELDFLIYAVHKVELWELSRQEQWEVNHCMEILKNLIVKGKII